MKGWGKAEGKRKKPADSTLNRYWRQAVLTDHYYRCFFCHYSEAVGQLDCHHIIYRRKKVLAWDWRNGVPVHRYYLIDGNMTCHQFAHTEKGKEIIRKRHKYWEYLANREPLMKKDWLSSQGLSENKWRAELLKDLKKKIEGEI